MPNRKLTGAILEKLKPEAGQTQTRYFDSQYGGLCIRVGRRDKSWCYFYRFDGKLKSKTLGRHSPGRIDHMDRAGAIDAMVRIDEQIEQGKNPQNGHKAELVKAKPTTTNPNALHRRMDEFLNWYRTSPTRKGGNRRSKGTVKQARRLLTNEGEHYYLEPLAHNDVGAISRADILNLLGSMSDTPAQANRIHAYLQVFFTWAWDRGHCDPSPMAGLKKQYAEGRRERTLSEDEIRGLWHGCLELGYPWGALFRLTLATGQRPGECRRMSRHDLHDGIWLVEGGDPKNRERHRIPLPKIAQDIVTKAPEFGSDFPFVFTTTGGKVPVGQGGKPYSMVKDAAGFHDWQPRDLRRTFFTVASEELDFDNERIGAITNQKTVAKPGVAAVYNKASWIRQKREALEAWNGWLLEVVK